MLLLSPNHLSLCFRIPKYIHTYSKRRWCIYQKINISFYLLGPYSAQICLSKFLLYIAESLVHAGNEDLPTTTHWDCQILHSVMRCLFTLAPVFFKKNQISIISVKVVPMHNKVVKINYWWLFKCLGMKSALFKHSRSMLSKLACLWCYNSCFLSLFNKSKTLSEVLCDSLYLPIPIKSFPIFKYSRFECCDVE